MRVFSFITVLSGDIVHYLPGVHSEMSVLYSCSCVCKDMLSLGANPFPFGNHTFPIWPGLVTGAVEHFESRFSAKSCVFLFLLCSIVVIYEIW